MTKLTEEFDKFDIWMTPPKNGFRSIKEEAPGRNKDRGKES